MRVAKPRSVKKKRRYTGKPKPNMQYKDSMFTWLFSNAVVLRQIYNGLYGTNYGKETPVKINTLSNVLFKNRKNDISFIIDDKLIVLLEHQSTINPNMPLRFLIYIARLYEAIIDDEALYRTKLLKVPFPEFIVFYNGPASMAEKTTLLLSEAFLALTGKRINLELEVTVYNINAGYNAQLAASCATLRDYMTFVAQVREYEKTLSLAAAIQKAINDCIKRKVLAKFLKKHGAEVRNMLVEEYNVDTAVRVAKEEGWEDGRKEGREEGNLQVLELLAQGYSVDQIKQQLGLNSLPLD
jgi:predicted transposase/invertase (TIGR01784 family)